MFLLCHSTEQNPALQTESGSASYEIYGARRFITIAYSEQHSHRTLSWVRWIHSTPSNSISVGSTTYHKIIYLLIYLSIYLSVCLSVCLSLLLPLRAQGIRETLRFTPVS
jgi:hypothetical protein